VKNFPDYKTQKTYRTRFCWSDSQ